MIYHFSVITAVGSVTGILNRLTAAIETHRAKNIAMARTRFNEAVDAMRKAT